MWEALTELYQSNNENQKIVMREKLSGTKMSKNETISSYLTRISQVRDELVAVGEKVFDSELVRTTLNWFTEQWSAFVKGVIARENLPTWGRLWDDFTQEETLHGN